MELNTLSPLLFIIYLDQLILSFKDLGVGCHLNGMFVGAFNYADDVTLLASTNMALKAMLTTCTEFAASHNLSFNASKTKCMYFNGLRSQTHGVVEFMGMAIAFGDCAKLLGVSTCCDVKDIVIVIVIKINNSGSVQKFYCKVNSVLYDFKDILCDVKTRLLDTYCLDLYRSQLWNYSKHDVNQFYVAWRKIIRRL